MPGYRLCLVCGERRPLFSYRGVVRADRHHTLCFECFRAEANRLRAWTPGGDARPAASRTVVDRAALLGDIALRRRRAIIRARRALEAPLLVAEARAMAS